MPRSRVQQSYGLRDESVPEPGGAGPGRRVTGVIGVFDNPVGLRPVLLGVEFLRRQQLHPGDVLRQFSPPTVKPYS